MVWPCLLVIAGTPGALALSPDADAGSKGAVGVVADPCAASGNSAPAEWQALDWGQRCRYWHENQQLPPASAGRVVFLGDSITEAWKGADPDLFSHDVLNRGVGGQTTEQLLLRLRADVIELHPRVLHLMAGTNDIAGNNGPTTLALIEGNLASLIEAARAHGIVVILGSVPPAAHIPWSPRVEPAPAVAAVNTWLRDYASREHLIYVDYHAALADERGAFRATLSDDGVHPNAAGYAVMGPLARAALAQALKGRTGPR
jgi:lysophospholipase L1-like esterase